MRGDIYIAAHLRRCLRHSVFGHVLQYTPSTSVLDALHLHHAIKSSPLRYPPPLHITFIEVKNELVKMKDLFPMKVITHTITHQANFAGGRSRLDLLLPSFLPSREEKKIQNRKNRPLGCRGVLNTPPKHLGRDEQKIQDRIFCPLRGHAVGRMQYAPTTCRQETLFPINSREERTETKMQERRKQSIDSGAEWHNLHMDRVRIETKKQDRIFCPLRGHAVGRMQYAPTTCRQEALFPINSREERTETKTQDRIFCPLRGHSVGRMRYAPTTCRQETLFQIILLAGKDEKKMQDQKNRPLGCRGVLNTPLEHLGRDEQKIQERRKQSIDSGAEWHTPFMRQGEKDAVWRDTFLEQRARVAIWRDRRLEEKYSHARFQLSTFGENSKPYKSSLVALSEQLRDIFAA